MWLNVAGESGARTGHVEARGQEASENISTASPMPTSTAWPIVPSGR